MPTEYFRREFLPRSLSAVSFNSKSEHHARSHDKFSRLFILSLRLEQTEVSRSSSRLKTAKTVEDLKTARPRDSEAGSEGEEKSRRRGKNRPLFTREAFL